MPYKHVKMIRHTDIIAAQWETTFSSVHKLDFGTRELGLGNFSSSAVRLTGTKKPNLDFLNFCHRSLEDLR